MQTNVVYYLKPFTDSDMKINLELEGDGELLGFGSADPKVTELYGSGEAYTFNGRALAIIKRSSTEKLVLKATAGEAIKTELTI